MSDYPVTGANQVIQHPLRYKDAVVLIVNQSQYHVYVIAGRQADATVIHDSAQQVIPPYNSQTTYFPTAPTGRYISILVLDKPFALAQTVSGSAPVLHVIEYSAKNVPSSVLAEARGTTLVGEQVIVGGGRQLLSQQGIFSSDNVGLPVLAIASMAVGWDGGNLLPGDIKIGRAATGNTMKWDNAAGTLSFSGNGTGLTAINGGNILANTISAGKLMADSVSAGNVAAGAITARELTLEAPEVSLTYGCNFQTLDRKTGANYLIGSKGERTLFIGAIHTEEAKFAGKRGLYLERGITNYLLNPSFELWAAGSPTSWTVVAYASTTITQEAVDVLDRASSLKLAATANYIYVSQVVSGLTVGNVASVSVYAHATVAGICFLQVRAEGVDTVQYVAVSPNFKRYEVSVTVGASGSITVFLFCLAGGAGWFDAIMLALAKGQSYCDGQRGEGYAWSGTADASASTRAATLCHIPETALGGSSGFFSAWVLIPWSYNLNASGIVMFLHAAGASASEQLYLYFDFVSRTFSVNFVWGSTSHVVSTAAQTFGANTLFHFAIQWSGAGGQFYMNGSLAGSVSAPNFNTWASVNIGHQDSTARDADSIFSEVTTLPSPQTATAIADWYKRRIALVDLPSVSRPILTIIDGLFTLKSKLSGRRIELDTLGFRGYDDTNILQAYFDTDGLLKAASGKIVLDASGISIFQSGSNSFINFYDVGGGFSGKLYALKPGAVQILKLQGPYTLQMDATSQINWSISGTVLAQLSSSSFQTGIPLLPPQGAVPAGGTSSPSNTYFGIHTARLETPTVWLAFIDPTTGNPVSVPAYA